jgi:uroporphyrinogen III methyltransferase/synthase
VVSLRNELAWFDKRPLFGKRIVITRARTQASSLVSKLSGLGAQCIEIPTIKIAPPEDISPLKKSIENIDIYDWLVFTSVNGVKFFFDTLFDMGKDVRSLGHLKLACIGPVTKERLQDYGIISDILPETYRAESVIKAFSDIELKNKKILLPRAKKARTILPEELTQMGAKVDEVIAYETLLDIDKKEELITLLQNSEIDAVTFTSSSTVSNFISLLDSKDSRKLLKNVVTASIGPITSKTAKSLDIEPEIEAGEYTIQGLVDSLLAYYESKNP